MGNDDTDPFADVSTDPLDDLRRTETELRIRVEKRRYDKPMTVVEGFDDDAGLDALASRLKKRLGTGGTVTEGHVELQGDHADRVRELLRDEGYAVA